MTNTDRRAGWDRLPGTHDISNGKGKTYRGLVRFERPCATCKELFGIYVTQGTADGEAHNSSFGLRNCEKHRMKMVAAGSGASIEEAERLRSANTTMKEELTGLYAMNKELRAENLVLKARLGAYELSPAIEQQQRLTAWTGDAKQMQTPESQATKELREAWLKKNPQNLPWQA